MKNYIRLEEDKKEEEFSLFDDLSYKERVLLFLLLSCIGYLIELGSLHRFFKSVGSFKPCKFVFLFSIGNLINIFSICILTGINKQIEVINDPSEKKLVYYSYYKIFYV